MTQKLFKVAWFLSLTGLMAVTAYVYASLGEYVNVGLTEESPARNTFFYVTLAVTLAVNLMVFIRLSILQWQDFRSWLYGLIAAVNFFMVVLLAYIFVINSGERYDHSRFGILLYGSGGLLILWIAAGPVLALFNKLQKTNGNYF